MDTIALQPRLSKKGIVAATKHGWRLCVQAGGMHEYQLAQLDDHAGRLRRDLVWRAPLTLSLRARVSSPRIAGTWGFGLWNDPFGFVCAPTASLAVRLPTLPQAAWFFSASPRSYLSFRDELPANGFIVQVFRSPKAGYWLLSAVLAPPLDTKSLRCRLSRKVEEDSARVDSDPCTWHRYEIRCRSESTEFSVDERRLLESPVCPCPPLGLVIWIDNQYAAFDPQGRLAWGVEENPDDAWLEIEEVRCNPDGLSRGR